MDVPEQKMNKNIKNTEAFIHSGSGNIRKSSFQFPILETIEEEGILFYNPTTGQIVSVHPKLSR